MKSDSMFILILFNFCYQDQQIAEDRLKYTINGGCTACIGLFILGKLYVANAGDSRGIISHNKQPYPMSFDFTPETENARIRKLVSNNII